MKVDYGDKVIAKKSFWFTAEGLVDRDIFVDKNETVEVIDIRKHWLGDDIFLMRTIGGFYIECQRALFNILFEVVE